MKKLLIGFLALSTLTVFAETKPRVVGSELNSDVLKVKVIYTQGVTLAGPFAIPYKHEWSKNIQCIELGDGSQQAIIDLDVTISQQQVETIRKKAKTIKLSLATLCDGNEVSSVIVNNKEVLK